MKSETLQPISRSCIKLRGLTYGCKAFITSHVHDFNGWWQDGAAAEASNRPQTSCSPLWKMEVNERENDILLSQTLQFVPDHNKFHVVEGESV